MNIDIINNQYLLYIFESGLRDCARVVVNLKYHKTEDKYIGMALEFDKLLRSTKKICWDWPMQGRR